MFRPRCGDVGGVTANIASKSIGEEDRPVEAQPGVENNSRRRMGESGGGGTPSIVIEKRVER